MKTTDATIDRHEKPTRERLKAENETRAPLIKLIADALPVFKQDDFESWTTSHITDLANRVKRYKAHGKVDDAYAKVK